MAAKEASTVSLANQAVKNWCLMYNMHESDSSMMEPRLFTWQIIVENLRVRRVDTTVLGALGVAVPNGTLYNDVLMEARLEDPSILQCEPKTIEEARLVL